MKQSAFLSAFLMFAIGLSSVSGLLAQEDEFQPPPTLGTYSARTIFEGDNLTVTPSAAPTGATRFTARVIPIGLSPEFRGTVEVDPATGVVRITNARPAGIYTVQLVATASDNTTATRSFTLQVIAEKGCSPFTTANFTGSATFSTGAATDTPQFGLVADFNKDGIQDYVVAVFTGDKTSVFLGDGNGGFGPVLNLPAPAAATNPQFPAVADFNGDGNADLAVTNVNGDNISIWLGNGNGTFGTRTDIASIDAPRNLVVGDFNNDGKKDLATVGSGTSLNVATYLGNGDGTFAPFTLTPIGGTGFALVVGDFNNDGNDDLLAGRGTSGRLLTGNGAGTFAVTTVGTFAGNNEWAEVGDFNNDGNLDFSIDNVAATNNMNVYLGNGSGGFANAPGSPFTTVGSGVFGHAAGDFDSDGHLDLAVSNLTANSVTLYRGSATGAMTSIGTISGLTGPRGINFADLNGDGRQDMVIIERSAGRITVRLGTCAVDITTSSLPNGTQGQPYPATSVTAAGGNAPYAFSATGLPAGLSISASGTISGTPTESGTFYPKITAADSSGTPVQTFRVIPLTIAATSVNVSVSGRVTRSDGVTGVPNAIVIMSEATSGRRMALTNGFGYYRFDGVVTGQTYTFSVSSKRYTFAQQTIQVNGEVTNLNFIAQP